MESETKQEIYSKHRGFVESYVCNIGTTRQHAVKNIKTALKKEILNAQDVNAILVEVKKENIMDFEKSTAYSNLISERKQRYELIKKELQQLLMN
ncbi:MAG: hypothetical protein JW840_10675 [Candidatus Thermoplasmatota archaeon]|nr:hypothetical protein [Candidatus Thermoplasmatota archaeon]